MKNEESLYPYLIFKDYGVYKDILSEKDNEIERLNNIIGNMEEELMTIYLDIMEYNEDYAKREIKKLKGVDKPRKGEVVSLEELESYEPKNSIEEEYYDEMWS